MACELANGGIVQVTVHGRFNNAADVNNVYQVQLIDGGPLTLNEVGEGLADWFEVLYDYVKLFCNALVTWQGISAQHLNGNCVTGLHTFTSPIVGSLTNDVVPPGVAALMSFQTGIARVVGRKYFGVLDESVIGATGGLTGTFTAQAANIGAHLTQDTLVSGLTWQAGHFSPKTLEWQPFTGYTYSTNPAYQRRRRVGSGS